MHDGIDTFDQGVDCRFIGQVAADHFFVRAGSRGHRRDVGKAQDFGTVAQALA